MLFRSVSQSRYNTALFALTTFTNSTHTTAPTFLLSSHNSKKPITDHLELSTHPRNKLNLYATFYEPIDDGSVTPVAVEPEGDYVWDCPGCDMPETGHAVLELPPNFDTVKVTVIHTTTQGSGTFKIHNADKKPADGDSGKKGGHRKGKAEDGDP